MKGGGGASCFVDKIMKLKDYEKAMETKKIMKGIVNLVERDKETGEQSLLLDLGDVKAIIPHAEVDDEIEWKHLSLFIGREINFIITGLDPETQTLICSRKEAQPILRKTVLKKMKDGASMEGKIVNVLRYGAYVEINGITGLLKNTDYSDDHTTISSQLKEGDTVRVILKQEEKPSSKLIFEAAEKVSHPSSMTLDDFDKGQLVLGHVRSVRPWGAYVCLTPGIDALCPIPGTGEIEEGTRVSFKITQVRKEENKIRGKIIKILPA